MHLTNPCEILALYGAESQYAQGAQLSSCSAHHHTPFGVRTLALTSPNSLKSSTSCSSFTTLRLARLRWNVICLGMGTCLSGGTKPAQCTMAYALAQRWPPLCFMLN